jgi:hypothetical protein
MALSNADSVILRMLPVNESGDVTETLSAHEVAERLGSEDVPNVRAQLDALVRADAAARMERDGFSTRYWRWPDVA